MAWQGVCMAGGVCGGMHGRGCVWQERWPLQWMVGILLECILVEYNQFPNLIFENISAVSVPSHTKLKKKSTIIVTEKKVDQINRFITRKVLSKSKSVLFSRMPTMRTPMKNY